MHLTRTEVLQISHVVSQNMTSAFKKMGTCCTCHFKCHDACMCVHHKWTRPVLKQNTANATRDFSQEKFRDTATEIMPCPSRWKAVVSGNPHIRTSGNLRNPGNRRKPAILQIHMSGNPHIPHPTTQETWESPANPQICKSTNAQPRNRNSLASPICVICVCANPRMLKLPTRDPANAEKHVVNIDLQH